MGELIQAIDEALDGTQLWILLHSVAVACSLSMGLIFAIIDGNNCAEG